MNLYVTAPGSPRLAITEFHKSVTWSGSYRQCARQLQAELLNPAHGDFDRVNIPLGSSVELMEGDDLLFIGMVLTRSQPSESPILTVTALDSGRYLARNEGWYTFRNVTPEAATAQICRDFGIPVGSLAATGVSLTRKFPGVPLYQIISTLYTMAGETTGKRYITRFEGRNLTVKAKSEGLPELTILPGANLMTQTTTEDASKLYTQAAIYSKDGKLIHTIDSPDTKAAYGTLQKIFTQGDKADTVKTAQAFLEDNGIKQTITVDCFGDVRMVTGETVALVDAFTGKAGRFWIDSDTHTWKNHQHFTKLTLNFRNIMDETAAGRDM